MNIQKGLRIPTYIRSYPIKLRGSTRKRECKSSCAMREVHRDQRMIGSQAAEAVGVVAVAVGEAVCI